LERLHGIVESAQLHVDCAKQIEPGEILRIEQVGARVGPRRRVVLLVRM